MRELAESAGKLTKKAVVSKLKQSKWHLDRLDKSLMRRMADVAPGIVVHEFKGVRLVKGRTMPSGPSTYRVVAYLGQHASPRWHNSGDLDSLDKALVHANVHADAAYQAWSKES